MPKFVVNFVTTASTSVTVEAENAEAAEEAAWQEVPGGVCAQCSGWGSERPGIEMSGDWEPAEGEDGIIQIED